MQTKKGRGWTDLRSRGRGPGKKEEDGAFEGVVFPPFWKTSCMP